MAKLSEEQITNELAAKNFKVIDLSNYSNMDSQIIIECDKGHQISTNLKTFRSAAFTCPCCDKSIDFINPKGVPDKKPGCRRIIAFDQATENFGLSIFDNGELVFYQLYVFKGNLVSRLVKIRKFLKQFVFENWCPDKIIMEDIQYQNGILTYKVLAMLLGVVQELCEEEEVEYEVVSPNVWRKYAGTCGKTRREEKILSVALVKEKYGVTVSDDVAEAILIGRYAIKTDKTVVKSFGKK